MWMEGRTPTRQKKRSRADRRMRKRSTSQKKKRRREYAQAWSRRAFLAHSRMSTCRHEGLPSREQRAQRRAERTESRKEPHAASYDADDASGRATRILILPVRSTRKDRHENARAKSSVSPCRSEQGRSRALMPQNKEVCAAGRGGNKEGAAPKVLTRTSRWPRPEFHLHARAARHAQVSRGCAKKGKALAAEEQALERKGSACAHAVAAHSRKSRQMLARKGCVQARDGPNQRRRPCLPGRHDTVVPSFGATQRRTDARARKGNCTVQYE